MGHSLSILTNAAASLTDALTEIGALYKATEPAVALEFNFDSSGKLQAQIESGANADLFLSAGEKQMEALSVGGFVDVSTRRDFLASKIVLVVPTGSAADIKSFEDCLTDKVRRVALGSADGPVGQYSREIFEYLKGWDIVSRKASYGSNAKEVLAMVERADADCGVVYSTVAATSKRVRVAAYAPFNSHHPVVYTAAILKGTKNAAAAMAFLEYLSSPEATAVFQRIGFQIIK